MSHLTESADASDYAAKAPRANADDPPRNIPPPKEKAAAAGHRNGSGDVETTALAECTKNLPSG